MKAAAGRGSPIKDSLEMMLTTTSHQLSIPELAVMVLGKNADTYPLMALLLSLHLECVDMEVLTKRCKQCT